MIVSNDLIIKSFDTGFQLSFWLSKVLIIKTKCSTIKSINTPKKLDSESCREMRWNEIELMKFHETWPWPRPNKKNYWILSKVSPCKLISLSDLEIFFLIWLAFLNPFPVWFSESYLRSTQQLHGLVLLVAAVRSEVMLSIVGSIKSLIPTF